MPAYLIGAYLRKYNCHIQHSYTKALALYLIVILCAAISYKYFAGVRANFFTDGPFQMVIAAFIFTGVLNQKPYYNKQVNLFAKTVFAAYLITDNDYLRSTVWSFFSFHSVTKLWEVNLLGIPSVMLLLVLAFFVDQIRIFVFKEVRIRALVGKIMTKFISVIKLS